MPENGGLSGALSGARLPAPTKIVCVGRNFARHAAELGNAVPTAPIFFLKPTTALIGPEDCIVLPPQSSEVHFEAELAVVVGARIHNCDPTTALGRVAAWTVLNDVTARDLQREDGGRFTRAKGFDTFCPVSNDRLPDVAWETCRIQCYVDGKVRQDGALSDMIFGPGPVLSHISKCMTLLPGDIVSFGTPAGVGALSEGERVQVRLVDASGTLLASIANKVVQAGAAPSPRSFD